MTVTTALTAQNTLGVVDIHYTPPEFVRKLIDACISDIGVDVVKTGIVPSKICLVIFNDLENTRLKHSDLQRDAGLR
jgi:hydroxymethylpyrimidine/phosphomethylpyrimidine kinase